MESGLKVSAAPLSTVSLTLWKDFFCLALNCFKFVSSLLSNIGVIPVVFYSLQLDKLKNDYSHTSTNVKRLYKICSDFIKLANDADLSGDTFSHFLLSHYTNHELIIAPFISVQLWHIIVTVLEC